MSEEDDRSSRGISRRSFLTGTGLSVAAAGILRTSEALAADAAAGKVQGPGEVALILRVNRVMHHVKVEPSATLADALRFTLGLTGTKVVCDRGIVQRLHGAPRRHAGVLVHDARGRRRRRARSPPSRGSPTARS